MTTEEPADLLASVASFGVDAALIDRAVENGIAALAAEKVGDHGLLVRRPAGWTTEYLDVRTQEDQPRERAGTFKFATVDSLVEYVTTYSDEDCTVGYMTDVTGRGVTVLTQDTMTVEYVLDDFNPDPMATIANRVHRAQLVLRPTTAARRWGKALNGQAISQEQMVELVIDGVGEIAAPPAADLRDLISDLHAIRTDSAKSIVSTTGGLAIELAENTSLHAGPGHLVTVPDEIALVLQPWTALDQTITTKVKIRPTVIDGRVAFRLAAPHLEDALNTVLLGVWTALRDRSFMPLWVA